MKKKKKKKKNKKEQENKEKQMLKILIKCNKSFVLQLLKGTECPGKKLILLFIPEFQTNLT